MANAGRYYTEQTERWGRVIRDREQPKIDFAVPKGEKPRTYDKTVAAHVAPDLADLIVLLLNEADRE